MPVSRMDENTGNSDEKSFHILVCKIQETH